MPKSQNNKFNSFAGQYIRTGNVLSNDTTDYELIIGTRNNPTLKNPELFLLLKLYGAKAYFSSLYEADKPGTYRAEYQGIYYKVILTDNAAEIIQQRRRLAV